MFQTKKKKIISYLENKRSAETLTAFDALLHDYINGVLKDNFEKTGMLRLSVHIDWLDSYKCIEIVGYYKQYIVEIKIEPHEFSVGYDMDEPEEYVDYSLESANQFYMTVKKIIDELYENKF